MKKIYKIMVFVMMLALLVSSVVAAPITIFAAGVALVGATIVLTKMPTKASVNTEVVIPKGTSTATLEKPTIVDPLGKPLAEDEITADGDNWKFTPKYVGDYKVTYVAAKGTNQETKEVFVIHVSGSSVAMSLKSNTAQMLPSKVGGTTTLVLPYPTIEVDGEEYEGAYVGEATEENQKVVSVKVTDPNHVSYGAQEIEAEDSPLKTKAIDGKTYYTFTPAKNNGDAIYGTYTITYIYLSNNAGEVATKSYKVNVAQNYEASQKDNLTFTWDGSLPTSAVLGNELTLPSPVVVDSTKNSESVATFTKVEVTYTDGEETKNVEVDGYKFTPMFEAKSGSYYTLTYKIYTLENLNLANYATLEAALQAGDPLTKTYTLSNVTDTVAPVPQVVGAYELNADGVVSAEKTEELKDVDESYLIPTKARTQVEIDIPAIYATDNYQYENYFKDLKLARTLIDEDGNTISLDGDQTINENDDNKTKVVQAQTNQVAKVTFRMNGTYTIRYRATDKANNTKDISYKIVVQDALTDAVAPSITLPTIAESVNPGEKLTFGPATIIDYKTDSSSPETMDTNIKKNVYYYLADAEVENEAQIDMASLVELKLNDTGKYEVEVPANTTKSFVVVVYRAVDDGKYLGQAENNVSYGYKNVRIFQVNDDVAPYLYTDDELQPLKQLEQMKESFLEGGENKYGQGETIRLGALTFKDQDNNGDDTSEFVTVGLKVYDKNENQIKVSGIQYTYEEGTITIKNGKFVTTVAGEYQIVITATDLGGNSYINSLRFEVNDTKAPVVEVESIPSTMELGKTYVLPTPVVYDDGEVIENGTKNIIEFGEDNPTFEFNKGTMEFKPLEKGTYKFRFAGKDGAMLDAFSDWYSVTVDDTIKPVIKVAETELYTIPETAPYKLTNGVANDIDIPLFTATDEYNGVKSISVKVTNPDGEELAVTEADDHYTFKPTGHGIYTVTYSAVDNAGNNANAYTYTIKVGDLTAPLVNVEDANIPSVYNIGDTLSVDLSKIAVTDAVSGSATTLEDIKKAVDEENADRDLKLSIVLKDADGKVLDWTKEDDIWTFKFTTAGKYTLSYVGEDKAGNVNDNTIYSFEVKSTSTTSSVSEATWGAVLIVVSVALLAGVVIFFIKTKDSAPAKEVKKEDK